ncbi:MAG: menaquinone biosynthesis protein [Bacteroidia bacterium]|nr:menaquinone biosynthesis protein [Bacteroidia bacterium]MDW8302427.1 menaquinone biosynthesis protein [Bacteroidia bacterium]
MLQIAAVSYLNTQPYLLGIRKYLSVNHTVEVYDPKRCTEMLKCGKANVGLIPTATLSELKNVVPISDYGIVAYGRVYSVSLYSQVPIQKISTIFLDYQSRTSIALAQILCQNYWKIKPKFIEAYPGYEAQIQGNQAGVIIGDRAIILKTAYQYDFDLAQAWYEYTQLPFVFALWVVDKKLYSSELHSLLNYAFEKGIQDRRNYYAQWAAQHQIDEQTVSLYLDKYIHYTISAEAKQGLSLFLDKLCCVATRLD